MPFILHPGEFLLLFLSASRLLCLLAFCALELDVILSFFGWLLYSGLGLWPRWIGTFPSHLLSLLLLMETLPPDLMSFV